MSLLSEIKVDLQKLGAWFAKAFTTIETDVVPVAITVTEQLKAALASGATDLVEKAVDGLIGKPGLAEEVVGLIKLVIPKVLAVELAIQGLPINPTPEEVATFTQNVIAAFTPLTAKDKLYTTLAAQIVADVQAEQNLPGSTWAKIIAVCEEAYQQYQSDSASN